MAACTRRPADSVTLQPVPVTSPFEDAIEPGVLQWACSQTEPTLRTYFAAHSVTYLPALIQKKEAGYCHIYYQPTIPGFEAMAEQVPVSELYFNLNTLAFLGRRGEQVGDSLDVAKTILAKAGRPLNVSLNISVPFTEHDFNPALRFHFGQSANRIRFHYDPPGDMDPWIQDFLKSGRAGGNRKLLVTRQAFEGNPTSSGMLKPMLSSFQEPQFTRSKLSFEGGDLLFVRDRENQQLVMLYGTSAKPYWGAALTQAEFEYVLRREFGAARAVYLGDVTPHVDYTLSILQAGNVALVAQPECDDPAIARAALDQLLREYSDPKPPELATLEALLSGPQDFARTRGPIVEATIAATRAQATWSPSGTGSDDVRRRIAAYIAEQCPGNPGECVSPGKIPILVNQHMALLQDWMHLAARIQLKQTLALRLLEVIRRQASGCDTKAGNQLDADAQRLQHMGYRVVRVPWLEGDGGTQSPWPGISYVNAAAIDEDLFVPQLGFGRWESDMYARLARELGEPYRVIPVPAKELLLQNGGIHCAVALDRDPTLTLSHTSTLDTPLRRH